ncbi:MAG: temperature sensitive supressor [Spirochaetes bacterium RBG_16_49_21]|nr:MAG: temperature sensitive supressor [Spirochaetes bacterium RBG_16_49_21]
MKDPQTADYSAFDRPEILSFLFYPRKEGRGQTGGGFSEIRIPVDEGIIIGGRFYGAGDSAPLILFFHGNGEIVADYDDIAGLYNRRGISFMPVDYRGYGKSTGSPTVAGMMKDCRVIFDFVRNFMDKENMSGPLIVMGRSLGSASALELASGYAERIDGLVIESGFAFITPLLRLLGVDPRRIGVTEEMGFSHIAKIETFTKPTLIIHADQDHIIPYSDGLVLYGASKSENKKMLAIKGANHNTIFEKGIAEYMQAMREFAGLVTRQDTA